MLKSTGKISPAIADGDITDPTPTSEMSPCAGQPPPHLRVIAHLITRLQNMLTIGFLADYPDSVPTLAAWFRAQWSDYYVNWSQDERLSLYRCNL